MKNIALLINSLQTGGAEKQAILTTLALKEKHNVLLITLDSSNADPKLLALIQEGNIRLVQLSGSVFKKLVSLRGLLRKEKIEYLFTYLATSNILGGIAGKLAGTRFIVGGIRNSYVPLGKFLIQRFFHNHLFSRTIFNNFQASRDFTSRGFKPDKIEVISNCFLLNNKPISREGMSTVRILSVGRFVAQKDYSTAIQSISKLSFLLDQDLSVQYTIIGYGEEQEAIQKEIRAHDLSEHIELQINPPDLNSFYDRADIFLNTSIFEGQSNSIMEAMSFSLPIVATDVGDNNRLVIPDFNGYLSPKQDVDAIARNLKALCESSEIRNRFGLHSHQHLQKHFSFEQLKQSYESLILNLGN